MKDKLMDIMEGRSMGQDDLTWNSTHAIKAILEDDEIVVSKTQLSNIYNLIRLLLEQYKYNDRVPTLDEMEDLFEDVLVLEIGTRPIS